MKETRIAVYQMRQGLLPASLSTGDREQSMNKTALITGAAARLGARTARFLHEAGYDIVIHYRRSKEPAIKLADELNEIRPRSATTIAGDLLDIENIPRIIEEAAGFNNRLDVLVNNASSFFSTPLGEVEPSHWDDLIGSNMKAPFFLSQQAAPWLKQHRGCIVNMVDVHGFRPKLGYSVYSMAKAANAMMVKSLARELGPDVRVNGVAPGVILWPEHDLTDTDKERILSRVALGRAGDPDDIAKAIRFLVMDADYITGHIIPVDGGRMAQQ